MNFKRSGIESRAIFKLIVSLSLFILFSFRAHSDTQLLDQSVLTFELKPVACIAQYMGQACTMAVAVQWQLKAPEALCLQQQETTIKCWQKTAKFSDEITVNMQQSSLYRLVRQSDNFVLARQHVTINYLNKYRRRLKPQWSIF